MRSKEEAHDYRYFPEPDLLPLIVEEKEIINIKKTLPELPQEKRERFVKDYGLPSYDAGVLTAEKATADFYEACVKKFQEPKTVSNWVMGELLKLLNENSLDIKTSPVAPEKLAELLTLIKDGLISGKIAKEGFV